MKEILRQLLEAEEAGREAAERLQANGDQILRRAEMESERIFQERRAQTQRKIEDFELQASVESDQQCRAIAQEADENIERLRRSIELRRTAAVAKVLAMLLGE